MTSNPHTQQLIPCSFRFIAKMWMSWPPRKAIIGVGMPAYDEAMASLCVQAHAAALLVVRRLPHTIAAIFNLDGIGCFSV